MHQDTQDVVARYWEKGTDGKIRCLLCPHACVISSGKTGRCRVRRNDNQTLYAEGYGAVSSLALDPIEKKPLRYFFPGTRILSVGSYGCSLSCDFCQNYQLAHQKPEITRLSAKQLAEYAWQLTEADNIGVAFTYNEPLINFEYVYDCAQLLKERRLKTVLVTNGYVMPEPRRELLPLIDAMNIDLKAYQNDFYQQVCGGRLAPVLDTIQAAVQAGCHVEITTLLIPGLNDDIEEIDQLAAWLASLDRNIPLHLTRYFPAYKRTKPAPINLANMQMLARQAQKHLKYVLLGNV